MRCLAPLLLVALLLASAALAFAPRDPDDCGLQFLGSYRAAAKNRAPDLPGYTAWNDGKPITVRDWYNRLCQPLDAKVTKKPRSNSPAMPGVETIRVTVRGYLVGAKYERHTEG